MAILNNSNAISSGGYDINNSLRFRSSASAYLNRTPGASNRQTWTISAWVKRGSLSSEQKIFTAGTDTSGLNQFSIYFLSDNTFSIFSSTSVIDITLTTTQVFRDPSAWYHIVVAMDTTQATASNRVKLYINGNQVTAFGTATYPAQNNQPLWNSAISSGIGRYMGAAGQAYFDGYMTEVNFIDGSAKTPSDFGETDTTTGSWKPKAYTGTYGTNGFYLKFSDIAQTVSSNVGLGKDFSGNTNYWVTNNIYTASSTNVNYDAMIDSPTLTSATVANYATWSPIDKSPNMAMTKANLLATNSSAGYQSVRGTIGVTSGKWYWEVNPSSVVGIATQQPSLSSTNDFLPNGGFAWGYVENGNKTNAGTNTAYGATFTNADTIGVAFDADAGSLTFYKNGISQGVAYNTGLTGQTYFPFTTLLNSTPTTEANFGQRPFSYTPPTGFNAWNTYNLPDSTIKKGNTVMDATLYTGNGSTQTITNAGAFKPDLVWTKTRSISSGTSVVDSVRGLTLLLGTATTSAEVTQSAGVGFTAFNSNGFSLGTDATIGSTNFNGATYVAWQWQAGQGSTSSNTSGSITSTVSANTTAGFSIVTYSSTSTNATIGHGLGVAPKMIIVKGRNNVQDWYVYHTSLGAGKYILLNGTGASVTDAGLWQNTTPTSSVFSIGAGFGTVNYLAYCWAEIAGFSKFGSYTGNGSTDGPFVYLGFRPKYVMVKPTSTTGSWQIEDTSRSPTNVMDQRLFAEDSAAETVNGNGLIDYLSNGFKPRVNHPGNNGSGVTYIYMAFAENPFKNALAR